METLFACEFIPTARILAGRIKKYDKPRWIFMMVLGAALLGFMIFNIVASGVFLFWLGYLLFALGFMAFAIFFPEVNGWLAVRKFKKNKKSDGIYRISFGEWIEVSHNGKEASFDYEDIIAVAHLKHSYELIRANKRALIVEPNSFTQGTFEEFKKFLQTQCPDLTIPE
jgi:hypothetical protein